MLRASLHAELVLCVPARAMLMPSRRGCSREHLCNRVVSGLQGVLAQCAAGTSGLPRLMAAPQIRCTSDVALDNMCMSLDHKPRAGRVHSRLHMQTHATG